jgi:hypothetical protein
MMRRSDFTDVSGSKDELLRRFQAEVPFVDYRIDGRECIQRLLVLCLSAWGYSDAHSFRATMTCRGNCPWGAKFLGDLDCLAEMKSWIPGKNLFQNFQNKSEREKWISRKLKKNDEVDQATLEALLSGRKSFNDRAPFRTIQGSGLEPGTVGKSFDREFSSDLGGALSLDECQLLAGDLCFTILALAIPSFSKLSN